MELTDRVVVVTGSASGIGRALARRFHAEGVRGLVVADRDGPGLGAVVDALEAARPGTTLAVACDVTRDDANADLVARAEETFGPIDLFFANAGVAIGTDLASTSDDEWRTSLDVNLLAHVHAARHLLPGWLARGEGYFCSTASAAGLLAQIGSVTYSVTKHAAVAFAEWLSITYGDRGVKVSCLCPQGVNTPMLQGGSAGSVERDPGEVVRVAGEVLEPEDVADAVVEGIRAERFLILPHPEVHDYLRRKADDPDRWLAGMRRLQARALGPT